MFINLYIYRSLFTFLFFITLLLLLLKMTTQRKELTIFERGEIIGAWKCGISERKIAETLNHPKTTIHNIIFAYKNNNYEKPPPRSGRPPIMK